MDRHRNNYVVIVSKNCKKNVFNTYEYIAKYLEVKNASNKLIDLISEAIDNLKFSPYMYPVVKKYKGTNVEYRRIVLGNFIMLYSINEKSRTVYLSHFYCGKTNYLNKIWNLQFIWRFIFLSF